MATKSFEKQIYVKSKKDINRFVRAIDESKNFKKKPTEVFIPTMPKDLVNQFFGEE